MCVKKAIQNKIDKNILSAIETKIKLNSAKDDGSSGNY